MKNTIIIFLILVAVSFTTSCRKKQDPEPEFQFMKIIGGDSKGGKDWSLVHFYSKQGISSYENTVQTGIDGKPALGRMDQR